MELGDWEPMLFAYSQAQDCLKQVGVLFNHNIYLHFGTKTLKRNPEVFY